MIQRLFLCLLVSLAAGLGAGAAHAQSSIKVVVNGIPITTYDIAQRARLMALSGDKSGTKGATEDLINDAIRLAEAQRYGIAIPDVQVDRAFASIAERMKLTSAKLTAALSQEGINASTLKSRIRAQMAWGNLVQARASRTAVRAKDITAALLAKGDPESLTTTEFMLQQIIFVVPKGSSSAYAGQRRREAEAFRQRFKGCEASFEQAKGLRDVVVRDMGRRTASQLQGPSGKAVVDTPVGKTTRPETTDLGIELYAVCEKRAVESTADARTQIENKLVLEKSEEIAKDYLKELRDKAIIQYR